ncbi:tetratricopeptide repeat protein 5 [Parasteatoda tepidariorum]|uniref:tetratricopeptide repeat protein 5 n=1 Tax=Parasteatoda tepidariorum TaxID=114398 RepID=UPI001C71DE0D|nr:tetratricopeptide repeat protein 5 [Parasteatoda tepidariorum]
MSLQESVKKLYEFRDFFFEDHSSELADKKTELLASELNKTLKLFVKEKDESDSCKNAESELLKAKALNVLPEYSPEAFEILTKLVKFHPRLVDALNELGLCFWKKGDVKAAKKCFENALREGKNAESLQNLSMILRQLGETPEEKQKNMLESLEKAKEAVEVNDDGKSWYIVGNANLSLFFSLNQSPNYLKESLLAYNHASQDKAMKCNPDLYYNWAMALKYDENYKLTLEKLELSIKYDPLWTKPQEELESLVNHLKNIQLMISTKGKLKSRKIREIISALKKELDNSNSTETFVNSIGRSETYQHSKISDLQEGSNTGKMLKGKVACHVYCSNSLPFTFCLLDEKENCFAVNVYNMAQGKGVIIGDSVIILDPHIQHFNFAFKDNTYAFSSIRVNSPLQLVANKRRFGRDTVATPQLSVIVKSD